MDSPITQFPFSEDRKLEFPFAEVLGYPTTNTSEEAQEARKNKTCRFTGIHKSDKGECKKLNESSNAACSVYHDGKAVVNCPQRFEEGNEVFVEAARFFFAKHRQDAENLTINVRPEKRIYLTTPDNKSKARYGNIDFVLELLNEDEEIVDIGTVELQSIYITGNMTKPYNQYMDDRPETTFFDWRDEVNKNSDYPSPDVLSSIKRLSFQIFSKGSIVADNWQKRQVIVTDSTLYDFFDLGFGTAEKDDDDDIAWFVCELNEMDEEKEFQMGVSETRYGTYQALKESFLTVYKNYGLDDFKDYLDEYREKHREKGKVLDIGSLSEHLVAG